MKSRAPLALAAAAAAAIAWLALRPGSAPTATPSEPPTPAAESERSGSATAGVAPRDRLEAEVLPEPPADPIRVTVVDDATGAPVAGAEVVGFVTEAQRSAADDLRDHLLAYRGQTPLRDAEARTAGRVARTGADGVATVDWPSVQPPAWAGASLHAHAPGRAGALELPWSAWEERRRGGAEIRIRPTQRVVVEVVDAGGAPASGLTVLLLAETDEPDREPRRMRSARPLGRTDTEGRIVAERFETHTAGLRAGGGRITDSAVTVRLCGGDVPPVPLAVEPPPAAPLRVTLPPTGAIRLELPAGAVGPYGRLLVRTDPVPAEATPASVARDRHTELAGAGDFVREHGLDVLVLPYVAVGAALRVEVSDPSSAVLIDERIRGPARPGETATVRLGYRQPLLGGRLVDPDGRPAARAFRIAGGSAALSAQRFQTLADGRFRIPLGAELAGTADLRLELATDDRGAVPAVATIEHAGPLPVGAIDAGDVRLTPLPVLAEGRCIDDAGAAVARPSVVAFPVEATPAARRRSPAERARLASVLVRADGTFTVHGAFAGAELALVGSAAHVLASGRVVVPVGATHVTLVLPRAANAVATARGLPEAHDLLARLVAPDGTRVGATWHEADGGLLTWMWSRIRPDRYRFELAYGPTEEVLRIVEGVEVAAAETTRDPRLQDLRIDGLSAFRLCAVAAGGGPLQPVADGWADDRGVLVFGPAGDGWRGRSLPGAVESIVNARAAPARLLVVAPGHRPAFAVWNGEDVLEVPMAPAPRVVVRVPPGARVEAIALRGGPELRLATYGEADAGALDRWPGMTPRAVAGGAALFVVPEPGRYGVELTGADAPSLGPDHVDVGAAPTTELVLTTRTGR